MVTTMDVVVLELWSNAVATTPIIKPHRGLLSRGLLKAAPASLPGRGKTLVDNLLKN